MCPCVRGTDPARLSPARDNGARLSPGNSRWSAPRCRVSEQGQSIAPCQSCCLLRVKMGMGTWRAIQSGLLVGYRNHSATFSYVFPKKTMPPMPLGRGIHKGREKKQDYPLFLTHEKVWSKRSRINFKCYIFFPFEQVELLSIIKVGGISMKRKDLCSHNSLSCIN